GRWRERLHAATCTLVGQMRPAVYETPAVCKHLSLLSHIGEMVGRHGFAPCSRRLRAETSLSKFATRNRRDAKAELNRRSQACEVLTDTSIRVAKVFPSAPKPASGHYFDRARPLPGSERRQKDECRLK